MTTRDDDNLRDYCKRVADTVRQYADLIESGNYGGEWAIYGETPDSATDWLVSSPGDIVAGDEDTAVDLARELYGIPDTLELYADLVDEYYSPTIAGYGDIDDYPLEIVDERGREFAVVICIGGPHIEIVADGGRYARLEGYWGGSRCTLSGGYFDVFLDYFIDRD